MSLMPFFCNGREGALRKVGGVRVYFYRLPKVLKSVSLPDSFHLFDLESVVPSVPCPLLRCRPLDSSLFFRLTITVCFYLFKNDVLLGSTHCTDSSK